MQRPSLRTGALLAVAGITLALGGAPLLAAGADHLDAPALGGLTNGVTSDFAPHSDHGNRDINDVYVFGNSNHTRTTFAMTTNPAVNLGLQGEKTFGTNVRYIINVDRTGDAVQDLAYVWRFGPASGLVQSYTLTRYTGANARSLAHGVQIGSGSTGGTGIGAAKDGAKVFAGVRADPFFFDLTGFIGTLFGIGTDCLSVTSPTCDPTDFFSGLNTNAVVLEVPNDSIGGSHIGVWGVTSWWNGSSWAAGDQMGRPAINTVFNTKLVDPVNSGLDKNRFNATPPSQQRTAFGGIFRTNIVTTLENVNAVLGTTGAPFNCTDWDSASANAIADFLLPDVLTYQVGSAGDGTAFNGRALGDDVIDAELGVTTHGCVTTDGVDDSGHTNLSVFPYLGVPH
jgi:uncharacterized protein DUF4331